MGDCLDILKSLPGDSVDSVVTDAPHGIQAADQRWDYFSSPEKYIAFIELRFRECLRVLKPGGYAVVCGAARTAHRLGYAIERAGFEIRDVITHLFAQGAAPSINVSRAIDVALGAKGSYGAPKSEAHGFWLKRGWVVSSGSNKSYRRPSKRDREAVERAGREYIPATKQAKAWVGWGTALRPSSEHWILARKPLAAPIERNLLRHRVGALNIDAARLDGGGWPGNVVLSHADRCEQRRCAPTCPVSVLESQSEGVSRFFYVAKPRKKERGRGNSHVSVKSTELMDRLIQLVTPPGGTIIDPFCGTGTTGLSAVCGGWRFIGVEHNERYAGIARRRLAGAQAASAR